MKYHYIASQEDGRITEGDMEAGSTADVLAFLSTQRLQPVSIRGAGELSEARRRLFSASITSEDKVFLMKYLSLMLRVGTDLLQAINILIADFDRTGIRAFLVEVRSSLERGSPFYSTFERHPRHFSPVIVNMIKAGEASGELDRVFRDLSDSLEKEEQLRKRIRSALVYPALLFAMSAGILVLLVTFALPRIAGVFADAGFTPPPFSRFVFSVGLFVGKYLLLILLALAAAGVGSWVFFGRTSAGKKVLARFVRGIPVIRGIFRTMAIQRFASTLSSLMSAGLPTIDSLEITADTVGDPEMKEALIRISRQGIARGLTIGDAFRREEVFPRVVTNLISVSEKAGHTEEVLKTLADFYETEIDASLKTLVSFLEPALLLAIGIVIGVIALAVIVPIYQLVAHF
ncbi:MAG: type II secretion system F family protein [Candidatus Liptonbacteria bacterium]|nr:type II secretion system F family protein [Candidatus Liptonbacteria bacterium]